MYAIIRIKEEIEGKKLWYAIHIGKEFRVKYLKFDNCDTHYLTEIGLLIRKVDCDVLDYETKTKKEKKAVAINVKYVKTNKLPTSKGFTSKNFK